MWTVEIPKSRRKVLSFATCKKSVLNHQSLGSYLQAPTISDAWQELSLAGPEEKAGHASGGV